MVTENDKPDESKEKEWDNPQAPEKATDDRDKEQILRQFKEAKRRHDNLSDTDETQTEQNTKDI